MSGLLIPMLSSLQAPPLHLNQSGPHALTGVQLRANAKRIYIHSSQSFLSPVVFIVSLQPSSIPFTSGTRLHLYGERDGVLQGRGPSIVTTTTSLDTIRGEFISRQTSWDPLSP